MQAHKLLFVLLAGCLLPSCALLALPRVGSGPYVGVSGIAAWDDFGDLDPVDAGGADVVTGIGVRAGYRILPFLGAEIAYEDLDGFDVGPAEADLKSLVIQAKGYPFPGRFEPYVLVGAGIADGRVHPGGVNETDLLLRLGAGLELELVPHVSLFAEGAHSSPGGDLEDLDTWTASLGALLRF